MKQTITTTTPTIYLGNCQPNSNHHFTFNITNNSIEKVKLSIRPSCGCTKPVLDKETMGPLEMQYGKGEIHLNSNKGVFNKFLIITDTNSGNVIQITITGNGI